MRNKAEAIGKILVLSSELDTARGEHSKLQNILGKLYYQKGGKWYYDIPRMERKTISELNKLVDTIQKAII